MPDLQSDTEEGNWECGRCTLQNSIKVLNCIVCGSRKKRVSAQGNSPSQNDDVMSTPICGKRKRNKTQGKNPHKKTQGKKKVNL